MFIGLFLQSCLNEDPQLNESLQSDETLKNDQAVKLVTVSDGTSRRTYSFLSFKDFDTFYQTIDNLEAAAELADDQFIASYPNLSGEKLTDKEISIGYDPYKTYTDFTKQYGLAHSMIDDYIKSEANWLNNAILDETKDPDIKYRDLEPEELTMLNSDGVVQIGKEIFIQAQNGLITIPDGNTNTLFDFLDNWDFSGLGPIGPITISWFDLIGVDSSTFDWLPDGGDITYTCHKEETNRDWWHVNSTRKIRGVVKSVYSGLWGAKIKSKTKYYRRYWAFGYHWLPTRASSLTAALDGYADNEASTCGDDAIHFIEDIDKTYKTNKVKVKYVAHTNYNAGQYYTTRTHTLKGVHKKGSNFRREHYVW